MVLHSKQLCADLDYIMSVLSALGIQNFTELVEVAHTLCVFSILAAT